MSRVPDGGKALQLALGLALASILGAWFFELALGYAPCKLCLLQRWPYYLGLPVGVAGLLAHRRQLLGLGNVLIVVFALIFVIGMGIAIYHAGAEWKFWPGPTDCGGRIGAMPADIGDLRKSLSTARVVRCDEAALRILGLSFAGWNVLVSAAVARLALRAVRRAG